MLIARHIVGTIASEHLVVFAYLHDFSIHVPVCTGVYRYVCMYECMYASMYRMYVCMYLYMYVRCVYLCVYLCMYLCLYVSMHIFLYVCRLRCWHVYVAASLRITCWHAAKCVAR